MKKHIPFILIALLAFAFGWTARGDHIYGGMFRENVRILEGVMIDD